MQKGSLNKAILIGNVGRDPETRYMPSGTAVCNFSIATNETWKDQDGNPQNHTEWHNCDAFGKSAEMISQWVKKGQLLMVEGMIRSREYSDKEGINRKAFSIRLENFTMLGKRNNSETDQDSDAYPNPLSTESGQNDEDKADEVPF